MVRFAVAPPKPSGPRPEPFAAQLALAQIHSRLAPLTREAGGYEVDRANLHGFLELPKDRGFAGYGLARALRLLLDVLEGLSALHDTQTEQGQPFTHGELVPALMRVDSSGAARLLPLAPWHWSAPGTLASADRIGHLAPERLLGDAIDQRADVFSAGVLLWEALAGRRLFESDSSDEIIMRLMGGRVSLPALPPELGWAAPLKEVAMCALSVDPGQRYASASDLAEAIEAVAFEHVATHAEVAAFLGAREPHGRPSVISRPSHVPTHNSSLSALVSPVSRSELGQGSSAAPAPGASSAPRRRGGQLWAAAAALSLLVAMGVGFVARGALRKPTTAAAAVPPKSEAPLLPAPTIPEAAAPVLAPPVAPPADTGLPAAPASAAAQPGKPAKSSKGAKSTSGKPKAGLKYVPRRDKEAEKYGI